MLDKDCELKGVVKKKKKKVTHWSRNPQPASVVGSSTYFFPIRFPEGIWSGHESFLKF